MHLVMNAAIFVAKRLRQQHAEWRDEVAIQLIQQRLSSVLRQ
ncbi:hypothetical protein [Vibrio parahaemolyticus]|nr:hypothetical protein [Vibrio parahaemolyticus]